MKRDFSAASGPEGKGSASRPPRWNLADLFPGKDSPAFEAAILESWQKAESFSNRFAGKVADLTGKEMAEALTQYEGVVDILGRIGSFTSLVTSVDHGEIAWQRSVSERVLPISKKLLFFELEINKMEESTLLDKLTAPEAARFIPWIRDVRSARKHQLSDELEQFIHDMAPASSSSWVRLYDQTMADLRFEHRGRELTYPEIANVISSSTDPVERKEAWGEFVEVLDKNKKLFGLVINTLADIKTVNDTWRRHDTPESARHLANQIEPAVVDAMTEAVREAYPRISHRYYAWKAKKFGVEKLHPSDRNAPLPGDRGKTYGWDEARDIVLGAFGGFEPTFAEIAKKFFDGNWIDAEPRPGKQGGAFSHSTVPSAHPYILTNFFGTAGDIKTLAHELGHGVHQHLSARQGPLMQDTPLTIAETASVFGEMLTFRAMLDAEKDPEVRRTLIADKIEDMLNTVVRQTSFHCFEQALHAERREKGELPTDRIGELWLQTQKESLGPAIDNDVKGAEILWTHIPHFIHTPFYVYAYAFGDCLVNALYGNFETSQDKDGFKKNYVGMLESGGTKRHKELLTPFGLDATDPEFWKGGLKVIERYMDELFELDRKIELDRDRKAHPPKGPKAA